MDPWNVSFLQESTFSFTNVRYAINKNTNNSNRERRIHHKERHRINRCKNYSKHRRGLRQTGNKRDASRTKGRRSRKRSRSPRQRNREMSSRGKCQRYLKESSSNPTVRNKQTIKKRNRHNAYRLTKSSPDVPRKPYERARHRKRKHESGYTIHGKERRRKSIQQVETNSSVDGRDPNYSNRSDKKLKVTKRELGQLKTSTSKASKDIKCGMRSHRHDRKHTKRRLGTDSSTADYVARKRSHKGRDIGNHHVLHTKKVCKSCKDRCKRHCTHRSHKHKRERKSRSSYRKDSKHGHGYQNRNISRSITCDDLLYSDDMEDEDDDAYYYDKHKPRDPLSMGLINGETVRSRPRKDDKRMKRKNQKYDIVYVDAPDWYGTGLINPPPLVPGEITETPQLAVSDNNTFKAPFGRSNKSWGTESAVSKKKRRRRRKRY